MARAAHEFRAIELDRAAALALLSSAQAWAAEDAVPATADAAEQRVAEAEELAERAYAAYVARDYATAVALYSHAFERAPSADALFNIARIYDVGLRDRALAISFYRRYIADPGAVTDRIQIANERLVVLRDAELAASRSPAPEPVAPAADPAPDVRADTASFGADPGWRAAEVTGVILGITGVVALGVGTGYGIAAMNETETVRDICPNNVCSEQRGIDAADSASDHATVSTIAFASGGALLALGAVCYFWLGDRPGDAPRQTARQGLQLAVGQRPGGLALELGGAW